MGYREKNNQERLSESLKERKTKDSRMCEKGEIPKTCGICIRTDLGKGRLSLQPMPNGESYRILLLVLVITT